MIEEVDLDDEEDDVDDAPPESFVTVDLGDGLCHSRVQVDFDPSQDTEEDILECYANAAKSAIQIHPNLSLCSPWSLAAFMNVRWRYYLLHGRHRIRTQSRFQRAQCTNRSSHRHGRYSLVTKGHQRHPCRSWRLCTRRSCLIGGHRFDHHFFVSQEGVGTGKQDVILGQPWLMWYEASLAYTRKGTMRMRIWQHGDSEDIPAPVSVMLCNADAPRNATALNLDNRYKATVEDVPEDQEN
ncbi:hypothetical protein Hypma_014868 [Hypsizygus marmoreus]|uniref:Uncharacterized protein n=1 Tax=Hypsizygus marmoreus TaxID=39966 RepID=A0A369KCI2_HYPMA|nr:hypothetical protein Hypma_014868 [Hypsizygus marmoreus]